MSENISDIRRDYKKYSLNRQSLDKDPFLFFKKWLEQAIEQDFYDPTAFALSTVSENGRPSSRMLLLKGYDENGFIFYTNYKGRKGSELENNPFGSMLFFWDKYERQVRIEGKIEKISKEDSEKYFITRPYTSRIGAWASKQSEILSSRGHLIKEAAMYMIKYPLNVPVPDYWGGYRLIPDEFEFWQGRESRMHDRFKYKLENGIWVINRLYP
ncbi:MAG: pyridoxamine 5'-phosphate oxidase [bacterium]